MRIEVLHINQISLFVATLLVMSVVCLSAQQSRDLLEEINSMGLYDEGIEAALNDLDSIARTENDLDAQYEANYRLGKYYLLKTDPELAKQHLEQAAQIAGALGDPEREGFAYDRIGIAFSQENKLDSALLAYQHSITTYTANDLEHRLWTPFQGISRIYQRKGNFDQAFEYGEKALASLKEFDEPIATTIVLNHLLNLSSEAGNYDRYGKYYEDYLKTFPSADIATEAKHITAFSHTGSSLEDQIVALETAIAELSKSEYSISLMAAYHQLGQVFYTKGDISRSIEVWENGLRIGSNRREKSYELAFNKSLAAAYEQLGNYRQALSYTNAYQSIRDSLTEMSSKQAIDELQVQYETAKKEQTILQQESDLQRKARNERALIVGIVALIILALAVYISLRSRMKLNKIVTEQRDALHQQEIEQLRQSSRIEALDAMVTAQEQERRRIAFDLHDQLGGLLTNIKLRLQRTAAGENPEITEVIDQLDIACDEVRKIAHDMMPHALLKMGIDAAVGDMLDVIRQASNIEISYQNLGGTDRLSEKQQISLYRIINELIQNSIKHANPSQILIQFSGHNGTSSLVVEDDGKGFDKDELHEGLGLRSVHDRVEFLGGEIAIESSPGQGTSVSIDIPVVNSAA